MVLVFMSVYLTKHMHFTLPQAGIVMAMFGIGSMTGALIGGKLVDRIGFYPILIFSLLLSGIMLIALGQMRSYPLIAFFTFLVTATGDMFRPANSAAISAYSTPENFPRAIALNRLAMNLGFTLGPVLGGWIASYSYNFLFWVDGITCLAAAVFIYQILPKPKHETHKEPDVQKEKEIISQSPYRDRAYLLFLLFTTLYATAFFQFFTSLPLFYKNEYHLSEQHIGWLLAFNGAGVVCMEMLLIYKIQNHWTRFKFIALGILFLVFAYMMLIPVHSVGILVLSMFFITISEMLAMPFMSTYAISRAPKSSMGRYMALYAVSWSLAQMLAPIVGTHLIDHYGYTVLWVCLSGIALISFSGFRYLEYNDGKKLSRE